MGPELITPVTSSPLSKFVAGLTHARNLVQSVLQVHADGHDWCSQGNRGFAFALYYAVMNVAALSVGVVLDFFRITIRHGLGITSAAPNSLLNSGLRLFVLTGESGQPHIHALLILLPFCGECLTS